MKKKEEGDLRKRRGGGEERGRGTYEIHGSAEDEDEVQVCDCGGRS